MSISISSESGLVRSFRLETAKRIGNMYTATKETEVMYAKVLIETRHTKDWSFPSVTIKFNNGKMSKALKFDESWECIQNDLSEHLMEIGE